jgi:hypothetical protein
LNMLGTIIHETLKVLYEPFIGKIHLWGSYRELL